MHLQKTPHFGSGGSFGMMQLLSTFGPLQDFPCFFVERFICFVIKARLFLFIRIFIVQQILRPAFSERTVLYPLLLFHRLYHLGSQCYRYRWPSLLHSALEYLLGKLPGCLFHSFVARQNTLHVSLLDVIIIPSVISFQMIRKRIHVSPRNELGT